MKRISVIVLAIVLILSVFSSCSKSEKQTAKADEKTSEAAPILLRAYNPMPLESINCQSSKKICDLATEYSDGKLAFDFKHSGQLGNDREAIEQTIIGTLDMESSGTGIYGQFYDQVKIFDLPFLFKSEEQAKQVTNGPIGEQIYSKMGDIGLEYLATGTNGLRQVSSKIPINSVEDVKGLNIRLPEMETFMAVWKSWGANPTPIPAEELYTALKTGTVDAQDNAAYHTVATKAYEVQKYFTVINYVWMGLTTSMNKAKYDSLPEDLQKVMKKAAKEGAAFGFSGIDQSNEKAYSVMEKAGLTVNRNPDRDSFMKNIDDIYAQFSDKPWYNQEIIDQIRASN